MSEPYDTSGVKSVNLRASWTGDAEFVVRVYHELGCELNKNKLIVSACGTVLVSGVVATVRYNHSKTEGSGLEYNIGTTELCVEGPSPS